ncbi:GAF domain-containing protein [Streptomyces luteolifulvus]|uniref:GAF domain-containing protein n=1 Tax=Streptomyces luteolifulvus TaxID=2615112 RepID=A0A6H9UNR8_9ACTN|nr:GAF domain-containing protein [Streptomyces luteolifulvus]
MAPLAVRCGYRAVHALPLRVQHRTIGAVNLLLGRPGALPESDLSLAQALADVAALALVHWTPDPLRPTDIDTRT